MRPGLAACTLAALTLTADAPLPSPPRVPSALSPVPVPVPVPDPLQAIALAPALGPALAPLQAIPPAPDPAPLPPAETPSAITPLPVDDDLPAYVVRPAANTRPSRTVFLTGSCTTPVTYLERFQKAAADHGGIIALQGDKPCRDGSRRWSADTLGTAARIDSALRAAGFSDLTDITLVGYSQGAERAEWLAHRFPAKYTRFILMAGPIVPSHARFSEAHGVVTLAGYGDVRENMAGGAKRLRRASIPAIYMELPGVQHGELAPAANDVVARAFDWLDANALSSAHAAASAPVAPPHGRGARAKHTRPR